MISNVYPQLLKPALTSTELARERIQGG